MTVERRWDVGVAVAVFGLRMPLLSTQSFGLDPDSWRIALSGAILARDGVYVPSRPPGFPLSEVISAGVWALGGGSLLFGLLTAAVSALAAIALASLLREFGASDRRAATASFAAFSAPVVLTASVTSMDYLWSLALLLAALLAAARGRGAWAGLFLGLAALARPTALAFGVAIAALLFVRHRTHWRTQTVLAAVVSAISLSVLLPVLMKAAATGPLFFDGSVSFQSAIRLATLDTWGPLGLVALGFGFAAALLRPQVDIHPAHVGLLLATAAVAAVLFARLPLEAAYLIPAVPMVVGALALALRPLAWLIVGTAFVFSPWVVSLEASGAVPTLMRPVVEMGPATLTWQGAALHDREWKASQVAEADSVLEELAPGSRIVAGTIMPVVTVRALLQTGAYPIGCLLYADPPPAEWSASTYATKHCGAGSLPPR